MSTLPDRPNTALVVIDVQKGVVGDAIRRDDVVGNISTLVDKARAEDVPVVWVQHSSDDELPQGSEPWEYVDELAPGDAEPLIHKRYGDSFEDTDLESRARRGSASAGSSSPVRRPMPACARRCTARSPAATTPSSSATRTPPRTSRSGAHHRRTR